MYIGMLRPCRSTHSHLQACLAINICLQTLLVFLQRGIRARQEVASVLLVTVEHILEEKGAWTGRTRLEIEFIDPKGSVTHAKTNFVKLEPALDFVRAELRKRRGVVRAT